MRRQGLADLDRFAGLVAGAGCDIGRDLDFGPGVLNRPDKPGGGLGGFAHCDCRLLGGGGHFAGLAKHSAGRSSGRLGALGQRLGILGRGEHEVADPALELVGIASAPVCGIVRFEYRDLGQHDVGIDIGDALQRLDAGFERLLVARKAFEHPADHIGGELVAALEKTRNRDLVGVEPPAEFGDLLNPFGIDLAVVAQEHELGRFFAKGRDRFLRDNVRGMLFDRRQIAVERTIGIVSGEPVLNLLVAQWLHVCSLASHQSLSAAWSRMWDRS